MKKSKLEKLTQDVFVQLGEWVQPGERVVVAVSGGADSMAMLDLLLEAREKLGFEVVVCHVHHHLREASDAEWHFVEKFCTSHQVPFYGVHVDVKKEMLQSGKSLEAAAHKLRHEALWRIVDETRAHWLALAHHADDRAETVLMNILRGTALAGLAAMPAQNGRLIRPMLSFRREEIEAYCAAKGLDYVTDESNSDTTFLRNKLRHETLPSLAEINPGVIEALGHLAQCAETDWDYIQNSADALFEKSEVFVAEHWYLLKRQPLCEAHSAVFAALLRQAVQRIVPGRSNLHFAMVKKALALLKAGHGRYDMGKGAIFECTERFVYIGLLPTGTWQGENGNYYHDFLQGACEGAPSIAVRGYEIGDCVFIPKVGRKSLKKIFQEQALPPCLRLVWPVIYDIKTKDIIWVPFLAQEPALMYYNSVTYMKVSLKIKIAQRQMCCDIDMKNTEQ